MSATHAEDELTASDEAEGAPNYGRAETVSVEAGPALTMHALPYTAWAGGRVRANEHESLTVRVTAPAPATTYAERISDTLREMRHRIERVFGVDHVTLQTRRMRYTNEDGDEINIVALRARVQGVSVTARADMSEELLDYLADHEDSDVREGVTIEIC